MNNMSHSLGVTAEPESSSLLWFDTGSVNCLPSHQAGLLYPRGNSSVVGLFFTETHCDFNASLQSLLEGDYMCKLGKKICLFFSLFPVVKPNPVLMIWNPSELLWHLCLILVIDSSFFSSSSFYIPKTQTSRKILEYRRGAKRWEYEQKVVGWVQTAVIYR